MKKITVGNEGRYNFHNAADIRLHIADDMLIYDADDSGVAVAVTAKLTPSQVKRINKHFCGISDCICGSSPSGMEQINEDTHVIHC